MTRNNADFHGYIGNNLVRRFPVLHKDPETGENITWMNPRYPATFPSHVTAAELIRSGDLESKWKTPHGDYTLRPEHMDTLFYRQPTPRAGTRESMDEIRQTGEVHTPIEIHAWSTDHGELTELVDGHHRLAAMYLFHPNKPIPVNWVDRTPNG